MRLRFGVGNNYPKGHQAAYVLSGFSDEECQSLDARIDMSIKMIYGFSTTGIERTMSDFNGK